MITFFSTPKPFRGHIGVIQRNAIHSWKLANPGAEVILFGDEEGAAEAARDLGARHEPEVQRNSLGTPLLSSLFERADRLATHQRLCFLNADILLLEDFCAAVSRLAGMRERSLMVGRRCDVDISEPWDFSAPDWGASLRSLARERGKLRPPQWIDYFAFPRGLLSGQVPPFAVGRPGYDNWLLWKVRATGVPVVDATQVVLAIHQNHDYAHHPGGQAGLWQDVEARQNAELLGAHYATIDNATHRLTATNLRTNYYHWVARGKRRTAGALYSAWFGLLGKTRPVRRRLGVGQPRALMSRNPMTERANSNEGSMGAVNKLVGRVLRKAAQVIDPPPPIHFLQDEYVTWLCYANAGMLEKGNLYSIDYAISHLPSAAPILEIGTFCGLSTNVITHFKRKHGVSNPLVTCDKWDFENVDGRATIPNSPVLFSDYKAFSKQSYIRNIELFSRDDLPFTFEMTADEFFRAWSERKTCSDVLGRAYQLGGPFSFCYIDGNHTYEHAKQDFLHCDASLETGGFILFDDSTLGEFSLHKLMPEVMALSRYRLVAANPYHLFQKVVPGSPPNGK